MDGFVLVVGKVRDLRDVREVMKLREMKVVKGVRRVWECGSGRRPPLSQPPLILAP